VDASGAVVGDAYVIEDGVDEYDDDSADESADDTAELTGGSSVAPPSHDNGKGQTGKDGEKSKDGEKKQQVPMKRHSKCPGQKVIRVKRSDVPWLTGATLAVDSGSATSVPAPDGVAAPQGVIDGKDNKNDNKDQKDNQKNVPEKKDHQNKKRPVLVTYCFRIKNTGNTFLFPITLVDPKLGKMAQKNIMVESGNPMSPLAPGDSITFILKDFPLFKSLENTATVIAQPSDAKGQALPGVEPVRDEDSAVVIIVENKNGGQPKQANKFKKDDGHNGPAPKPPVDGGKKNLNDGKKNDNQKDGGHGMYFDDGGY